MYKVVKSINGDLTVNVELDEEYAKELFEVLKDDVYKSFINKNDLFDVMLESKHTYKDKHIELVYEKHIVDDGNGRVELSLTNLSTSPQQ